MLGSMRMASGTMARVAAQLKRGEGRETVGLLRRFGMPTMKRVRSDVPSSGLTLCT